MISFPKRGFFGSFEVGPTTWPEWWVVPSPLRGAVVEVSHNAPAPTRHFDTWDGMLAVGMSPGGRPIGVQGQGVVGGVKKCAFFGSQIFQGWQVTWCIDINWPDLPARSSIHHRQVLQAGNNHFTTGASCYLHIHLWHRDWVICPNPSKLQGWPLTHITCAIYFGRPNLDPLFFRETSSSWWFFSHPSETYAPQIGSFYPPVKVKKQKKWNQKINLKVVVLACFFSFTQTQNKV